MYTIHEGPTVKTVFRIVLSPVVLKTMNEKDELRKLSECLGNASRHLFNLLSNEGSSSQSKNAVNDLNRSRVSTAILPARTIIAESLNLSRLTSPIK